MKAQSRSGMKMQATTEAYKSFVYLSWCWEWYTWIYIKIEGASLESFEYCYRTGYAESLDTKS